MNDSFSTLCFHSLSSVILNHAQREAKRGALCTATLGHFRPSFALFATFFSLRCARAFCFSIHTSPSQSCPVVILWPH